MPDHSLKVFAHHLTFLDGFPELRAWLNLNGFTVRHTHQDFRMQVIYTFWDNHTSDGDATETNDATESIMVAYCLICKTVEVGRRTVLFSKKSEAQAIKILDESFSPVVEEEIRRSPEENNDYPWLPSEE